ncbi:hypothetical protein ACFLRX_04280 [Acidobacteriota bacterium]
MKNTEKALIYVNFTYLSLSVGPILGEQVNLWKCAYVRPSRTLYAILLATERGYDRCKKKMVGDTGFEPVTSTVCKRHKKKGKG